MSDDLSTSTQQSAQDSSNSESSDKAHSPSNSGNALNEWAERRSAEISERDRVDAESKRQLQEDAIKHIDDFYEIYNKKKEQQVEQSRNEASEFLDRTNNFFKQDNTIWDRVLQLINVDDADIVGGRDRSKFKDILLRLKDNENAPGVSRPISDNN